jgi:hypothetical protein
MTIYYKYRQYEQIILQNLKITITGQQPFYWLEYKSQFCIYLSLNTNTGTYIHGRYRLMYDVYSIYKFTR